MSIVTIEYEFYNPRNPKCRACKFWNGDFETHHYAECTNNRSRVRSKYRAHNDKACQFFSREPVGITTEGE